MDGSKIRKFERIEGLSRGHGAGVRDSPETRRLGEATAELSAQEWISFDRIAVYAPQTSRFERPGRGEDGERQGD